MAPELNKLVNAPKVHFSKPLVKGKILSITLHKSSKPYGTLYLHPKSYLLHVGIYDNLNLAPSLYKPYVNII